MKKAFQKKKSNKISLKMMKKDKEVRKNKKVGQREFNKLMNKKR